MRTRKRTTANLLVCMLAAAALLVFPPPMTAHAAAGEWPAGPKIEAPSAIVMDVGTGTVLYEKGADKKRYPASTTKILTTLVALENSAMDETVTFSKDAVYKNEGDTSHISRDVGEQMTMEQCLYAIMLESANECAYAVAEHVGKGDYQAFIRMMNERAKELGCTNTNFTNSNGLPDKKHVTTCRDLALMARAAIQNPEFRKITGTTRYKIPPTNKHKEETPLNNHHQMLSAYKGTGNLYEYCVGGKTGYTGDAKNTLVTFAEKNGMTLVCVVMKCEGGVHYGNTRKLLDYCFDHFALTNVARNETRYDSGASEDTDPLFAAGEPFAQIDSDAQIVLPKGAVFADTTVEAKQEQKSGDVLGTLVYSYAGRPVGTADVKLTGVTADSLSRETAAAEAGGSSYVPGVAGLSVESEKPRERRVKVILAIAIAAAAVAAVFIAIYLYNNIHRIWRRKAARDRRYKVIKNNRKWNKRGGRRR